MDEAKWIILISIILTAIICSVGIIREVALNQIGAAKGTQTGYITSVEYYGGILYGSELVYIKSSLESTQEEVYCIINDNLKTTLIEAQVTQKPVTITYSNPLFLWNSDCYKGLSIVNNVVLK